MFLVSSSRVLFFYFFLYSSFLCIVHIYRMYFTAVLLIGSLGCVVMALNFKTVLHFFVIFISHSCNLALGKV